MPQYYSMLSCAVCAVTLPYGNNVGKAIVTRPSVLNSVMATPKGGLPLLGQHPPLSSAFGAMESMIYFNYLKETHHLTQFVHQSQAPVVALHSHTIPLHKNNLKSQLKGKWQYIFFLHLNKDYLIP